MRYSVNSRQKKDLLDKADEIIIQEQDYRSIPDLCKQYPNKPIILITSIDFFNIKKSIEDLINFIQVYKNLILQIDTFGIPYLFCKNNKVKFYYKYPVNNFYDVNALIDLGVEYIKISAPLTFEMDKLSNFNIKFRMCPNVAYDNCIPRENGLYGQWVRPEDVEYYNSIYIFDFENVDLIQEKTLFYIYAEQKTWPGDLNLLFTNFNIHVDNKIILKEIGKRRSNCGQRCQNKKINCNFCETALSYIQNISKLRKEERNSYNA